MATTSILIVTGTFDKDFGKPSYFGDKIYEAFKKGYDENSITFMNGGNLKLLDDIFNDIHQFEVIVWTPLIDNSEDKYLIDIKKQNSKATLIQSKRNDHSNYTTFDLVKRMFAAHSNLCLEISKVNELSSGATYNFKILDPLGNLWYEGPFIDIASNRLVQLVKKLRTLTRYPSVKVSDEDVREGVDDYFIEAVKSYGWRFSALINHAINKERFLGNASTRCMLGFPSQKENNVIKVSKRNVDKASLSADDFVTIEYNNKEIWYQGSDKPSVDSAVQLMLFNHYYNVKYIIHGHTYIPGAAFTKSHIPCGYVEEFPEIISLRPDQHSSNFAINLIGHGCIILASDLNYIAELPMVARDFPEDLRTHWLF